MPTLASLNDYQVIVTTYSPIKKVIERCGSETSRPLASLSNTHQHKLTNMPRALPHPLAAFLGFLCLCISATTQANGIGELDLPNMGESATRGFSQHQQNKYGHQAWLSLKRQGVVLDDPEIAAYLQALGERIAAGTSMPIGSFTFFPVASNVVNAFAMPGGYIGVHAGLISEATSEHELGGVMGHEIIHVTQQHIARIIEKERPWSAATTALVIAALLLGGGDPDITQAAIGAGLASGLERRVNYTRGHEHEADRLAVPLLAQAELDPRGMADFFHRLYKLRANYDNTFSGILQTHPLTATRISEAQQRALEYPVAKPKTSGLFEIIRERTRVLSTPSRESPRQYYPAAMANVSSDAATLYGQSLAASIVGDHHYATTGFKQLVTSNPSNLLFQLGYARALQRSDDDEAALRQWKNAYGLFADNSLLLYRYGEALLQLNKPAQAKEKLISLYVSRPDNAEVNDMLARASADLGQLGEAHIYKANYWAFSGEKDQAIRQLKAAITNADLSQHDKLRIQAKIDELKGSERKRPNSNINEKERRDRDANRKREDQLG